jgi:Tfp pilus assembly protein PilF
MSDGPDQTAAEEALGRGDLAAAEELGRTALRDGGSLEARLTLAQALAWQGRGRDADAVLSEVDDSALSESDLMAWALPKAANQFWMLNQPERATAFLRAVRRKLTSDGAGATLDALLGTFAMNAGSPERAMQIAQDVLDSPDADRQAVGWAAAAAALCSARMGRFADVDALAARAIDAGHPGLLRFTSAFGQTTALTMSGDLDRAEALARRLMDDAEHAEPGYSISRLLLADVLITRGECAESVEILESAAAALAPTGYSWGPLAWMLLAQALGQVGRVADAGRMLARAESRHGLKSMLFAPELSLARAWTAAARRDGPAAVDAAREAARAAERGGQSAVALRSLLDAVRLGDSRAGDALERLGVECVVGALALDYARALTAGDAAGLDEASSGFAGIGMHGVAADAARQAAALRG